MRINRFLQVSFAALAMVMQVSAFAGERTPVAKPESLPPEFSGERAPIARTGWWCQDLHERCSATKKCCSPFECVAGWCRWNY